MHGTQIRPFALHYTARPETCTAGARHVLGVVGYNAARPASVPAHVPFINGPLVPVGSQSAYEVWTSPAPVTPLHSGPVHGTRNDDLSFAGMTLPQNGGTPLEDTVEQAYLAIFRFLDEAGGHTPLRFWNYLSFITQEDHGLERYKRFNIGRHRAFTARLEETLPPVASCLGAHAGPSCIYVLAARKGARPIENPRQMSAYDYPALYGPRSPSFSRAALFGEALLISGTASIVGHETLHEGDLPRQIAETIKNLRALIAQRTGGGAAPAPDGWAFKIYLRDPAFYAAVDTALCAAFGTTGQRLYLHADICRPDLMVEIEAVHL